jgi:hypothetical protein
MITYVTMLTLIIQVMVEQGYVCQAQAIQDSQVISCTSNKDTVRIVVTDEGTVYHKQVRGGTNL